MPLSKLADENFNTRLTGLAPYGTVTLNAQMADDFSSPSFPRVWQSRATFQADGSGEVSLAEDAPLPGSSYTGAEKMGMFYSMTLAGEDDRTEFPIAKITSNPTAYTFTAEVGGSVVATSTFQQRYLGDGVTREVIDTPEMKGILFTPAPGHQTSDGVLITLSGSDGGVGIENEARSALFASRGYRTLLLPYFNYPGLPATSEDLPLEFFRDAIDWVYEEYGDPQAADPYDSIPIALAGGGTGGQAALRIASLNDDVDVVLGSAAATVEWLQRLTTEPNTVYTSWTLGGVPITPIDDRPFRDDLADLLTTYGGTDTIVDIAGEWSSVVLENAPNAAAVQIPIEDNPNCHYLLVSGRDDQNWPSRAFGEIAEDRMEVAGLSDNIRHRSYSDAGHILLLPNQPTSYDHLFVPPPFNIYAGLAGTPLRNHQANQHAWQIGLDHLADHLATP
ncbi:acyl-CoA thioesterase/bile acid-CoA:amino acid N-acyltransferase family protein [Actinokineospora sp. 24-640]